MASELLAAIEAQQVRLNSKHNELEDLNRIKRKVSKEVSRLRSHVQLSQHELILRLETYLRMERSISSANILLERSTNKCLESDVALRCLKDVSMIPHLPIPDFVQPFGDLSRRNMLDYLIQTGQLHEGIAISVKKHDAQESELQRVREAIHTGEARAIELKDVVSELLDRQDIIRKSITQKAFRSDTISSKLSIANEQITKLRAKLSDLHQQLEFAKEAERSSRETLNKKKVEVQEVIFDLQEVERLVQKKWSTQNVKQVEQRLAASHAALHNFQPITMQIEEGSSSTGELEARSTSELRGKDISTTTMSHTHNKLSDDPPFRTESSVAMKKPRMVRMDVPN